MIKFHSDLCWWQTLADQNGLSLLLLGQFCWDNNSRTPNHLIHTDVPDCSVLAGKKKESNCLSFAEEVRYDLSFTIPELSLL